MNKIEKKNVKAGLYKNRYSKAYLTDRDLRMRIAMLTSFGAQNGMVLGVENYLNTEFMNALTGLAVTIAINTIGAMMIAGVKKDFKELEGRVE